MDALPPGAIPVDDASATPQAIPEGAIPVDQYQGHSPAGDLGQQPQSSTIGAGLEGIASGVLGPAAPFLEHHLLSEPYADILQRQNEHPIAHGVGQGIGLVGSSLTGVGEGALLTKAGEGAASAANLGHVGEYAADAAKLAKEGFTTGETAAILGKAPSLAAKIGSSAVSQAAEMAILQGSDETAKMIMNDPETSSQTALANIGLATALGGAGGAFVTGVISPLWKATVGNKATEALEALSSRFGGIEGNVARTSAELEAKSGIAIPTEFKSVLDEMPGAKQQHSILSQSDSSVSGRKYQKNLNEFYDGTANKAVEVLGKSPEDIEKVAMPDKYVSGNSMGDSLHNELKPEIEAISGKYDAVTDRFKGANILPEDHQVIADKIAQKSLEEGWDKAASDSSSNLVKKVMEKLPKQETADDLKKFITNLRNDNPFGSENYQAAKQISRIIQDSQENVITRNLGPRELVEYQGLKGEYKNLMDKIDGLNEHLHVGRYDGPQSFLTALKELSTTNGEGVLNRLSGKNKANALQVLSQFPETLAQVRDYHLDNVLHSALETTADGQRVNVGKLLRNMEKMSPQTRELIANGQQQEQLEAISRILSGLKDPNHNYSNTARTIEKLTHSTPTAMSIIPTLLGHGEIGLAAYLSKLGFKEGSDAMRYGLLRFLSSNQKIDSEGFKSMVQMMHNTVKGETLLTKAAANVFKPGTQVLVASNMPAKEDRAKLDKIIAKYDKNPEGLTNLANAKTGHYLPDHQMKLTEASTQAIQYLQQLKPHPYRSSPLDKEIAPGPVEMARYNRALDIANQPAIVLQHAKDGTLQASDLQDLNAMYPAVYKNMVAKVSREMVNAHNDETIIPYKTRMGISLLMGQPIDSTMSQQNILAAQPQPQQQPQAPSKGKASAIGKKTVTNAQTPSQAAEQDRSNREK